jgi:hypothetical protein
VWKLGKMWSVSSRVRLWRERYLVVRSDRAEFYKSDKEWRSGGIPLKILALKCSKASQKQGGTDAGKWVFSLEETSSVRCHVLAVESEQLRDKWLHVLQAAADPADVQAFIQGVLAGKSHHQPVENAPDFPAGQAQDDPKSTHAGVESLPRGVSAASAGPATPDRGLDEEASEEAGQAGSLRVEGHGAMDNIDGNQAVCRSDGDVQVDQDETLAKFAQRWKLEAEKMTCLAQSSMASQVFIPLWPASDLPKVGGLRPLFVKQLRARTRNKTYEIIRGVSALKSCAV